MPVFTQTCCWCQRARRIAPPQRAKSRLARARVPALLALLLVPIAAFAADSIARVDAYLARLKTLSAEFVQVVQDKHGQVTERATGTLSISRPDRFRWDYREPYAQTIVADGKKLWLYDPDLDAGHRAFARAGTWCHARDAAVGLRQGR